MFVVPSYRSKLNGSSHLEYFSLTSKIPGQDQTYVRCHSGKMTTQDAKTYLSKRDIPRLFESLMTGLMYHRPQDHIKYLIECLQKVHEKGQENITWSSFVDIRRTKTPLPPISNGTARPSSKGSRPSSRTRTPKDEGGLMFDLASIENFIMNGVTSPEHVQELAPVDNGIQTSKDINKQEKITLSESSSCKNKEEKRTSPLPDIPKSTEKANLPDIPIVIVMGAPGSGKDGQVDQLLKRYPGWCHLNLGKTIKEEIKRRGEAHTKWKLTRDLLSRGEPAPEDVTIEVLLEALKKASKAKGIVITGFPRNMAQVGEYARFVSRIDVVFMIDCDESKAMDKLLRKGRTSGRPEHSMSSITNRMNYFKAHTLPAAKHYDDQGKLVIIDGDVGDDLVSHKLGEAFDKLFSKYCSQKQGAAPPKSAGSIPEPATYKKKYEKEDSTLSDGGEKPMFAGAVPLPPTISTPDTGRKPGLPQCPIIFVAGGPGSGKGTQCQRILQRYPDFVHLSMGDIIRAEISTKGTADKKWGMIAQLVSKGEMAPEDVTVDLLKEQLNKHKSAKAFVIEGFPRDKDQVEAFNKQIGGLNFVILFDCEEYYMQTRLLKRGRESGRVDDNPTAIANRLNFYKYNTLPVMKYFDDEGKLVVLDADRDMDAMFYDISQMFDFAFFGRKPGGEYKQNPKGSYVTYMTEVKHKTLDDETIKAAMKIKAGFEGGKIRQQKILRRGASYSSKHESSSDVLSDRHSTSSRGSRKSRPEVTAANQIAAGLLGYKHRVRKHKKKKAREQIAAGFVALKHRSTKQRKNKNKKPIPALYKYQTPDKKQKQQDPELTTPHTQDEVEAAHRIQAGFRGYQARQEFKSRKEHKDQREPEVAKPHSEEEIEAAHRIQAGFKGFQTRQEFKAKKQEQKKQPGGTKPSSQEEFEAAERIQAGFKGFQARKQFQTLKQQEGKKADAQDEPVEEEVIEATITAETDNTTGDTLANPAYTKTLDEAAKS